MFNNYHGYQLDALHREELNREAENARLAQSLPQTTRLQQLLKRVAQFNNHTAEQMEVLRPTEIATQRDVIRQTDTMPRLTQA